MSLIFPANPLLHLLTTDQTHKNLAQNKNSCYFFISRIYVVHLCCSPQYNRQRLPSIFISLLQKTIFSYYFIILLMYQLPLLCCTSVLFPTIQPTKIAKYFHIPSTKNKNSISILFYYFINVSYSSLTFDQLQQT